MSFTSEDLQKNLMTPSQVADTLGISKQLAGKILAKEGIKSVRFGSQVFVMRADLANWLTNMAERVREYQPPVEPDQPADPAPFPTEEATADPDAAEAVEEAEEVVSSGGRSRR